MKTEQKSITPSEAGLSLNVISGPRGHYADDWQAIEYTCELVNARRAVIWTGSFKLGIGHVKPLSYDELKPLVGAFRSKVRMTADEENTSRHWKRNGGRFDFRDKRTAQLVTDTAAKLAQIQNVSPSLESVCHSLLSDGAAFFDGQRFEDWASDLGYDPDSRKAEATFRACDEIGRALSRHLSRDELDGLREWAQNY
jgi:hypothetical protein